jgi:hypothetical protein
MGWWSSGWWNWKNELVDQWMMKLKEWTGGPVDDEIESMNWWTSGFGLVDQWMVKELMSCIALYTTWIQPRPLNFSKDLAFQVVYLCLLSTFHWPGNEGW